MATPARHPYRTRPNPEVNLETGASAIEKLIAASNDFEGEKTRIYLIETENPGQGARTSPSMRARGDGPGAQVPDGYEHVLSLDLDLIPELRERLGGRLLSLYARDIEDGDNWESTRMIMMDEGTTEGGHPIWVVPVDVPTDIFDDQATYADEDLDAMKVIVFNRPGWILGKPIYIQEEEGEEDQFLMQLSSSIGNLNLGDSGCLYVFEDSCFMQCS